MLILSWHSPFLLLFSVFNYPCSGEKGEKSMKLWFLVIALLVYLFFCLFSGKVALQGTKALFIERERVFEKVIDDSTMK